MEKTITKQTKSGLSYLSFENPGEIKVSDIGKTVMVAGKKELFIIYKVHSEGTPGFKTGGVECVIGMSGVSKYCYFLDQVKLYDGRDLTTTNKLKSTKGNKNKTT